MSRLRYSMGMTPQAWVKLKAVAREHHVSLTDIVVYLGEQKWHRAAKNGLWIKVGARPWMTPIAIRPETVNRYHGIARDLFIVSIGSAQDYPGLVLQAFADGLVVPAQIAPEPRPVAKHTRQDLHISRLALEGIRARIRPAKAISIGLNKLAARKPKFTFTNREIPPARRVAYRFRLKHDTIEFFADEAMRLGLRPTNTHGRISWASLFIEEFGRGRVIEAGPREAGEAGEPYELNEELEVAKVS